MKQNHPKPTVMVFADASYCDRTHAAGWGAWIKADGRESLTLGGPLKADVTKASDAEAFALANAVHGAVLSGYIVCNSVLMLQSDCVEVLAALRQAIPQVADSPVKGGLPVGRRRKRPSPAMEAATRSIATVLAGLSVTILVRHVYGHREGGGRNWVNRICDHLAKQGMRAGRTCSKAAP